MTNTRHGNTRKEIALDGNWMEVGRKHYLHGSGAEVAYDCNRYVWTLTGAARFNGSWKALWVAKYYAEKAAQEAA